MTVVLILKNGVASDAWAVGAVVDRSGSFWWPCHFDGQQENNRVLYLHFTLILHLR